MRTMTITADEAPAHLDAIADLRIAGPWDDDDEELVARGWVLLPRVPKAST